ncbi:MAG: hypothetical protein GY754_46875 [bacterium]|nr:hypothetical protein [bacterium]
MPNNSTITAQRRFWPLLFVLTILIVFGSARSSIAAAANKSNNKTNKEKIADIQQTGVYDWFWMFYEYEKYRGFQSFTIRPFFLEYEGRKGMFQASLMPVIYWRYKNKRRDEVKGLLGFVDSLDFTHRNGTNDYDLGFFPLFYYGSSPYKKDQYLMVWPFGGTIKGKFGMERITPILFPGVLLFIFFPPSSLFSITTTLYLLASLVPVYMSYEWQDYKAWAILWPLIQRGKSSKRDDFRILPFYAHNYKKGFYDNYSYLFIINYRKVFFKKDEHVTLFILPFYGRKWSRSGRIKATTILWPFFSWGYDKRIGDYQYNLPWPLVQIQDCEHPKIKKRIFFPFYGKYTFQDDETFFVTPLFFQLTKKTADYNSDYYIVSLLFWYFKRDYNHNNAYYGKTWRFFKFWPVFKIEYNDQGDHSFEFLSLLPLRDPEGYERLYNPLWSIVEYRRFRNGEKRLGLLLRTYYQRWNERYIQLRIPLLFSLERNDNKVTELSFLMWMFSYKNNREGRYMRIFWIPIRLGEGTAVSVDEAAQDELKKDRVIQNSTDLSLIPGFCNPSLEMPVPDSFRVTFRF